MSHYSLVGVVMARQYLSNLILEERLPVYEEAAKKTGVKVMVVAKRFQSFRKFDVGEERSVPWGHLGVRVSYKDAKQLKDFERTVRGLLAKQKSQGKSSTR